MLAAAGKAIKLVTSSPLAEDNNEDATLDTKSRKTGFKDHTREYFTLLKSINDRLQSEVQALEEAGLIVKEDKKQVDKNNAITHGGLGNFDVAWLNARSRDVGAQKEAELLKEARTILENMKKEKGDVKMENAGD
ncbi:hypothetical protein MRB53_040977 [Persea americana]|nr:hypothetical protein MRB53_040977 [Persea americana]